MAVISTYITTLAGIPETSRMSAALTSMITPFLPFSPRIYEGPNLANATGMAPLIEHIAEHPNFSARGKKKFEALCKWGDVDRAEPMNNGYLSTYINAGAVTEDVLIKAAADTMGIVDAPHAIIDIGREASRARENRHRQIYQAQHEGAARVFGIFRGLSGIAWRDLFGPDLVRYFGAEKLAVLPKELARQLDDEIWLLMPCQRHEDWTADKWCSGETAIIEALGADCFFNPVTGTLPTEYPIIRQHAPYPIKVRQQDADTMEWKWVQLNGYQG